MDGPVPVTVEQSVHFQEQGFLIVPGVLAPRAKCGSCLITSADLLAGRVELVGAAAFGEDNRTPGGRDAQSFRSRSRPASEFQQQEVGSDGQILGGVRQTG